MFNKGREAENHFLRVSKEAGKINSSVCMFVCHGLCVAGVLFYFLPAYQPLGLHRLSISDGAKLAKLRSVGPDETPVVRWVADVELVWRKHSNERNYLAISTAIAKRQGWGVGDNN